MHRAFRLGIPLLLATLLSLAGCSLPGTGPKAFDEVDRLANALQRGDLKGVSFSSDRAAVLTDYEHVVSGMGTERPQVSAGEVEEKGSSATGTLHYQWKIGSDVWAYDATVRLRKTTGDRPWRVVWTPAVVQPELKTGENLALSTVKPARGDILGAGDAPIVTNRPVLRVGLDKSKAGSADVAAAADRIARLVKIAPEPYAKQVAASGPRAFVQAIVLRHDAAGPGLLDRLGQIPGGVAISDHLPLAPDKDFAGALLGTVGQATAELVKDSEGRLRSGDDTGLSGLQKRYDEQLFGTRGAKVSAVSADGKRRELHDIAPVAGKPLRTTLDVGLQGLAQRVLAGVGPASALVAIRPSTGDLVAVASGPGSKGYNTATFGRYAPGSTFKVVSALALLRSGLTPASKVPCTPTITVDGKSFKNYSDYPAGAIGQITLTDALANSCNTAFISQWRKVTPEARGSAAAALGFGVDHDLGFPAFLGSISEPTSDTAQAADMIGQGGVLASPMAMAAVVASVVKGQGVVPRLLPDLEITASGSPSAATGPLTAKEAEQLRAMMRATVQRGSGKALADLPGPPAIAKTGTAEFGTKLPLPTHAWMVAAHGDLAVAVFVDRGDSGSGVAGPILERFLRSAK